MFPAHIVYFTFIYSSPLTFDIHFPCDLHRRREVPHLDAAVAVSTEEVAAGPGPNAAGSLTLMHHKPGDGCPVHRTHLTQPSDETQTNFSTLSESSTYLCVDQHVLFISSFN